MSRAFIAAVFLIGLTACTMSKNIPGDNRADTASLSDSNDEVEDTGSNDTAAPMPAWFGLDGRLSFLDGQLHTSSFTFRVISEDANAGTICVVPRAPESFEVRSGTPDETVYHWWSFDLGDLPQELDCEGADQLPDRLLLGLGALHPELRPALARDGLADQAESAYGVYANFDAFSAEDADITAYAFGYATYNGEAEDTTAVSGPPVPDGTYTLYGYYVFPLSE